MKYTVISHSPLDTAIFAEKLATALPSPITITLAGNLGSGKTEFAKAFVKARIGNSSEVTSPTYTICNIYADNLYHFDLYRLKHEGELVEVGLEEALAHDCLIEWPELAESILPDYRVDISFHAGKVDNEREITISAPKDMGEILKLSEFLK